MLPSSSDGGGGDGSSTWLSPQLSWLKELGREDEDAAMRRRAPFWPMAAQDAATGCEKLDGSFVMGFVETFGARTDGDDSAATIRDRPEPDRNRTDVMAEGGWRNVT